jgi:signal transduction histidine kinase
MKAKRSPLGWVLWAISMAGLGFSAYAYSVLGTTAGRLNEDLEVVIMLLLMNGIASSLEFFSIRVLHYRIALVARAITYCLLMVKVAGVQEIEIILLGSFAVETAVYEPYPRNLYVCSCVFLASLTVRLSVFLSRMPEPLDSALLGQGDFFFLGFFLIVPASLCTRYREYVISLLQDKRRLDAMVVELAKTNLQYQDFAAEAAEKAMKEERLRITRDIHDIVGYTLTNNIAMMEAATDLMRRNPLGVPALINAARDNAQEGLQQIRGALYRLRAQEEADRRGIRALIRLCRLFEKATGIEVRFSYGNALWEYGEEVDSAIYHLVQQTLLNSFRHGKAAHATVTLWELDGAVLVTVSDDGVGAESVSEGIGLRGVHERIERLAGQLRIDARAGSFSVLASIPLTVLPHGG